MAKVSFKEYSQGQGVLFPMSIDSKIPEDSAVRLVNRIVDELDLTNIDFGYKGGGNSSYHPRMMLKVLFYAYLNNVYSCRKIASQLEQNIHYMWLSGDQQPNFRTINNFRSLRLKDNIHGLFVQVVYMLVEMGYITLKEIYIDGTKIESKANRYTFVWRKSIEGYKEKLEAKVRGILSQIEEGIAQDNEPDDDLPTPINSKELKQRIAAINKENRTKKELKQIKDLEGKHLPKLEEYEQKLEIMGDRNSYSKTDPDATFMRMKDDHMRNGQLKPAYNEQIGTENQIIVHYTLHQNTNDIHTLKPHLDSYEYLYEDLPETLTADAGYGSEENYDYLEEKGVETYVKYNTFDKEQGLAKRKKDKLEGFRRDDLYYNEEQDFYVCPMGQRMEKVAEFTSRTKSGYKQRNSVYQAQNCEGCPLRVLCFKGKNNRRVQRNHNLERHKQRAREKLLSDIGQKYRKRRSVDVEPVFGHLKYNRNFNRFTHRGLEKVEIEFGLHALANNLKKMSA